jgi:hypothetical protein
MRTIEAAGTCAVAVIALLVELGLHNTHSSRTAREIKQSKTVMSATGTMEVC